MDGDALVSLRESFARWCEAEIVPHHREWERSRRVPRHLWHRAGEQKFLCMAVASEYGGQGADFRHSSVIIEELARCGATGVAFALHSDIIAPYIEIYGTEGQKRRWLPRMAEGQLIAAIALTEPTGGSDLLGARTTATADGDEWIINGSKTYISNGMSHDLCLVLCRTESSSGPHALSLFVVEWGATGFYREELCEKMGYHALDTAELRFVDCRVPKTSLLGARGSGLIQVMSRIAHERMVIAIHCLASAKAVHRCSVKHAKQRLAFGQPLLQSQAIRFALAESATEISVSEAFIERCIDHMAGGVDLIEASKAKFWTSEMLGRVADLAVQIRGGAGYMLDSAEGKAYVDARVQRIFGGTSEMLKEIIGRSL